MEKWEEEIIGSSVNMRMRMKAKTRRKYFKFTHRESDFRNDGKKLSRLGISCKLKGNSESPALAGENQT
jgi:hypothetical protein